VQRITLKLPYFVTGYDQFLPNPSQLILFIDLYRLYVAEMVLLHEPRNEIARNCSMKYGIYFLSNYEHISILYLVKVKLSL
jgi:hypothetical protein